MQNINDPSSDIQVTGAFYECQTKRLHKDHHHLKIFCPERKSNSWTTNGNLAVSVTNIAQQTQTPRPLVINIIHTLVWIIFMTSGLIFVYNMCLCLL